MDRLQAMEVFCRIVEMGSFTRAADSLNLPRPTVSNLIRELEGQLRTRLLHRTTRRVGPTSEGELYYQRCRSLLAELDEVQSLFGDARPKGVLKVDLPNSLGLGLVLPALPEFLERNPELDVQVGMSDRYVDLVGERVDCVVRVGHIADSSMVARSVGQLPCVNAVSPAYVARFGIPLKLADLSDHLLVKFFDSISGKNYDFEYWDGKQSQTVPMKSRAAFNQTEAYLQAALLGLGLVQIPYYHAANYFESGHLLEVLPQFRAEPMPVAVMYPHHRHLSAKVRVFMQWIGGLLAKIATR